MKKYIKYFTILAIAFSTNANACDESTDCLPANEVAENKVVMKTMHHNMMIEYSGDADIDFVRGMIPHHQGAVEMAKIELRYGKDPDIRKMAQNVINAQNKEIEFMKAWQAKHDKEKK